MKSTLIVLFAGLTLISGKAFIKKPSECTTFPCMIFEDNFDELDTDTWEHEITLAGGRNWEFQVYHNNRTNSFTRDGLLYIKPNQLEDNHGEFATRRMTLNLWGMNGIGDVCTSNADWGCERVGTDTNYLNPIQSARLRSLNSFSFKYGAIEVRAQMPFGDWLWPAIWLLPRGWPYGQWPASGEIDLVESRGNENYRYHDGESIGCDTAGSTLHFGPFWPENGYDKAHASYKANSGTFANQMHTFRLEWSSEEMNWYVDGEHKLKVDPGSGGFWKYGGWSDKYSDNPYLTNPWAGGEKLAPFDKEFYIIMNVAVGGVNGYFPDESDGVFNRPYPKPWLNTDTISPKLFWDKREHWLHQWTEDGGYKYNSPIKDTTAMKIDYVRVWKQKNQEE